MKLAQAIVAFALLLPSVCLGQSPASELQAAYLDSLNLKRLVGDQAYQTRYVTIYAPDPARVKREDYRKLMAYWTNSLSRKVNIGELRRVTDTVYALNLRDFGWTPELWEKLADVEPWFNERLIVPGGEWSDRKTFHPGGDGRDVGWNISRTPHKRTVVVPARWVCEEEAHKLSVEVRSRVPIVRLDWFINQSGEEGRQGGVRRTVGYYQWIGLNSLADAEKLAGFNKVAAQERQAEIAAVVKKSGVAVKPRQIFRFGAIEGSWWETRDSFETTGDGNALRNLDGLFKFDAREVYFALPNKLFAFALVNKKGELQAEAPSGIATDKVSTNGNATVKVGVSCIRCHVEGLRPIDDWARKTFTAKNELGLGSPDPDVHERLKQLYLGPLNEDGYADDLRRYTRALHRTCGMKPQELAKVFKAAWAAYEDELAPADQAREWGMSEKEMMRILVREVEEKKLADTIVGDVTKGGSILREHFEEALPLIGPILWRPK